MACKNVLIVYAHQEPKSFNGAMKDRALGTLETHGHTVNVSDLYKMKFDPTASRDHFNDDTMENPEFFKFQQELRHAAKHGTLRKDVETEIEKLLKADLLILQFPLYWLGMPAILKGWIERCLAENVAFAPERELWFDNGPFKHKKALLSFTTGGTASYFSKRGLFGDMDVILWPLQNSLRISGYQILPPQIVYAPGTMDSSQRKEILDAWQQRLTTVFEEQPIKFIHVSNFDGDNGFELSEEYLKNKNEDSIGPTVGQNLGRSFPCGSMTKCLEEVNGLETVKQNGD